MMAIAEIIPRTEWLQNDWHCWYFTACFDQQRARGLHALGILESDSFTNRASF
jgi:hypothetical protein